MEGLADKEDVGLQAAYGGAVVTMLDPGFQ